MNDLDQIMDQLKTLNNDVLLMAVRGEIDIVKLLHTQLVIRGMSAEKATWVGSMKASAEFEDKWGEEPEYK